MSWPKTLAAGFVTAQVVIAVAAGVMPASAADMPKGYPPLPDRALPRSFEANNNGGWYLRGDLGYGWGRTNDPQAAPGFANPTGNNLGNAPTAGFGFGIKRGWIRTDVTADYITDLKYRGTVATPDDVTAKMSAWTVLLNGYLDLGSWYRVTPYIGAGAGAARVKAGDYQSTVSPPFTGGSNAQWNFAWAAMAGVGFMMSPNLIADVGYRYLNLGDAKSATDAFGGMTFKNLAAHEVRVGLRWSFDDLPVSR